MSTNFRNSFSNCFPNRIRLHFTFENWSIAKQIPAYHNCVHLRYCLCSSVHKHWPILYTDRRRMRIYGNTVIPVFSNFGWISCEPAVKSFTGKSWRFTWKEAYVKTLRRGLHRIERKHTIMFRSICYSTKLSGLCIYSCRAGELSLQRVN